MVNFGKPSIGPRMYMTNEASGAIIAFPRRLADEALKQLLGTIPATLAAEGFVRGRQKDRQEPTWKMLVDYLVGLTRIPETAMDPAAVVAFWAWVLLQLQLDVVAVAN